MKKNIKNIIFISIFIVVLLMKNIYLFMDLYSPTELMLTGKAILLTINFILIFASLLLGMKKRGRIVFAIIFDTILSIILFINHIYYRYFNDFISVKVFNEIGQVGDISTSIYTLISKKDIIYFADIVIGISIVILCFFIKLIKKIFKRKRKKELELNSLDKSRVVIGNMRTNNIESIKKYINLSNKLKTIIVAIVLLITGLLSTQPYIKNYSTRNANRIVASSTGLYYYTIIDLINSIKDKIDSPKLTKEDKNEMKEYFNKINKNQNNKYSGIAEGKNVIFIQEESLSNYLIGLKINGQEVMPNLNELILNSYYNSNFYNEIGGGHSSDCELLALNGLYPMDTKSINLTYSTNKYSSLVENLRSNSYYTISAHGYRKDFWNREKIFKEYGFDESYFQDDYVINDKSGWGISDKDFFNQTIDKIKNIEQPFMAYFITLENHTPFKNDSAEENFKLGEDLEGTPLGNYIQMSHKIDDSFGSLIEKLKEEELYDNTILVIYGDHDSEIKYNDLKKYIECDNDILGEYEVEKVPFIIHIPKIEEIEENLFATDDIENEDFFNIQDKTLSSQVDIAATILNLLGIKNEMNISFGKDIFSKDTNKHIILKNGVIISSKYLIKKNLDESLIIYDIEKKEYIKETDEIRREYTEIIKMKSYSNLISQLDILEELEN